jgi:NAD(P)-dependent dehydrogenase (short-subunit alcohol dehydrogenase family)
MRDTLAAMKAAGAAVSYFACDVRDTDAFGDLIDQIYQRYGRIDGVIHGAGVIEDRLLEKKTLDSFRRVFQTKVNGAGVLAAKLRPETLRFLVFFSSVSGRFGNRGQADYAAANEALNKLAQDLDRRWPARVVALNWGPWSGSGMVTAEAERQLAERGMALVPAAEGCRLLLEELAAAGDLAEPEVLIAGIRPDARRQVVL